MEKGGRKHKGSLRLDWINKESSLYYEVDDKEGMGIRPVWVSRNDIRVSEPRVLKFIKGYGDLGSNNMLIRGDNLLVLKSLAETFKGKKDEEKVKCIYIDPPFNTGKAFKFYDDNLKHSQWLTMMRDRLHQLKPLMRRDGVILVNIDNEEVAYLKILMDEEFGRHNFVQIVTVKRASPAGFKTINPGPVTVSDYILIYARDKKEYIKKFKPSYVPVVYDGNYDLVITNEKESPAKWKLKKVSEVVLREKGLKDWKGAKLEWGKEWKLILNSLMADFALKNAERVVSVRDPHKPSHKVKLMLAKSKKLKNKVLVLKREDKASAFFYNGGSLSFYKNKLKVVDGELVPTELLTDVWVDINFAGIAREGDVQFKNSKKPEMLVRRIIDSNSGPGDLVLDCFAGSGTTGAVAHKLKRRWIMIEVGNHAEELIIPRLQKVVSGSDQSGVSKRVNWHGGGGFNYYKLGESLIYEKDMNWSLKMPEIAEAIFLHFQYKTLKDDWLEKKGIYLGQHRSALYHFSLSIASKDMRIITEDEYLEIVGYLSREKNFKHITIFTNLPIAVPSESLNERVMVKKIPAAILREYNLV